MAELRSKSDPSHVVTRVMRKPVDAGTSRNWNTMNGIGAMLEA